MPSHEISPNEGKYKLISPKPPFEQSSKLLIQQDLPGALPGSLLPLGEKHEVERGKSVEYGSPFCVRPDLRAPVVEVAESYFVLIQTIINAFKDGLLKESPLKIPDRYRASIMDSLDGYGQELDLIRLDILPGDGADFKIIETNANCPGGFLNTGAAATRARVLLQRQGVRLPDPLPAEEPQWFADWLYRHMAHVEVEKVAIFTREGGNRNEVDALRIALESRGVIATEVDPRESVAWSQYDVGFSKLSMQDYLDLNVSAYVNAVQSGRLVVQNGWAPRWIGDNKICLALLSDPTYKSLFPTKEYGLVADHLPWSRAASSLTRQDFATIEANKNYYVLKHPLSTRARSVAIGAVMSKVRWLEYCAKARADNWLVQEFCIPATMTGTQGETRYHDLAIGVVRGSVSLAFTRSSKGLMTNIAAGGILHPVFL